jgi:hypothetical protein
MAPPQPSSAEADIHLASSAIILKQILTERRAAETFDVARTTLQRRRSRKPARRDCQPNSKKLAQLEEEVIFRYILDRCQRGFAPTYAAVRDMADKLLTARGAGQVEQKWPANFARRSYRLSQNAFQSSVRQAESSLRGLCVDWELV